MNPFQNFIWDYRFVITVICMVFIYAMLEWTNFKAQCYALMLQAKRYAKDEILKSGDEQVEWVVKKAYQFLPKQVTIFISEKMMRTLIAYLYSGLKDYLDDGEINKSIK